MTASGCSVLQTQDASGRVDRLRLEPGESWDRYDNRPRHPSADSGLRGIDDMSLMLKSQKTF
jgi:hypothetical protein